MTEREYVEFLTHEEKIRLRQAINESLAHERELSNECNDRGKALASCLAKILGWPRIPAESSERRYVYARAMVAHQMKEEGFTGMEISKYLHRHVTSVNRMIRMVNGVINYPQAFRDMYELRNQFVKQIQNDIQ